MRWTRVLATKEQEVNTSEKALIRNPEAQDSPKKSRGFFRNIINKFKKSNKNIPEQHASFYHIEENKKSKMVIVITTVLVVMVIIVGTVMLISQNIKKAEEEEAKRIEIQKQREEEIARIEEEEARKEAERQAKLPKLTEEGIANMENIYHSDKKRVFLTFDDGPSKNTEPILNILQQEGIKATFFELGINVEAKPEMVKRAYDEGHYIASHGYSHVYSKIYTSTQTVLEEYNQCIQAIRNAIGESEYDPHLFRFPGGLPGGPYADLKKEAEQLLLQNNILNIDWNALSGDAEGNNLPVEKLMARTDGSVGTKNSVVLLMHDSQAKTTTVEALPQIIAYFRDRGYEFVNFYEIIK